ncbi:MAG TPA: hypothetical protein VL737_05180 [Candidatus Pristimantibacillus sp.]|nr:hypothetical protein [Candidatus Pristimantibacillus sp.]
MRWPSLEDLAERWTPAHTIAVSAWVIVLILGVTLLFRGDGTNYPVTGQQKTYAAENATFKYPANWTINQCAPNQPLIQLPGTIAASYKGKKRYPLTIYGADAFNCIKGRPDRLDIYPENMTAGSNPCSIATSTKGEKLKNGLYLELQEEGDYVVAIHIKQNSCYAPSDTVVLGFAFTDPNAEEGDLAKYGLPSVKKQDLLASDQYKDIRTLAESISY